MASFLIPFHSRRLDNLFQTLRFLERHDLDATQNSEAILLCHDECEEFATRFRRTRFFHLHLDGMDKPAQVNTGVLAADHETVVLLDGDRVLPPHYFTNHIPLCTPKTMVTTRHIRRLFKPHKDHEILGSPSYPETKTTAPRPGTRNAFSGNVIFRKYDFLAAGGMNKTYQGYGFEDTDMTLRMTRIGVRTVWSDAVELHLHHERSSYGNHCSDLFYVSNGLRLCREWGFPVGDDLRGRAGMALKDLV